MCYRGEEKHWEKKEERQLEREREREKDLWEEERPELMIVRVWGEKKQREERKSEKTYHERERRRQKIMFLMTIDEDNIYRRCNAWEREIVFQKKIGKQPIENKSNFY